MFSDFFVLAWFCFGVVRLHLALFRVYFGAGVGPDTWVEVSCRKRTRFQPGKMGKEEKNVQRWRQAEPPCACRRWHRSLSGTL